MRIDFTTSHARLDASRIFSRMDALRLVPPPKNKTLEDLRSHIRAVLFQKRTA